MNRNEWLDTLPKGSVGAEIGVAAANYSLEMLRRVKPKLLYLVDRYAFIENKKARNKKELLMHMAMANVARYTFDGVVRPMCAWSLDVAKWMPDETLDWVYIDADHKTKSVYDDVTAWYPKVKVGGIVAGHDYKKGLGPYPGVNDAVKAIQPGTKINVVDPDNRAPSFWFRREA